MKLSEAIREAQAHLTYDDDEYVIGKTSRLSCICVNMVSVEYSRMYSAMLREYGFVQSDSVLLHTEHWRWFSHEQQFFRIQMMELMACIAEDNGN